MKTPAVAAAAAALALLTYIQFPGHTWLQQDTQIYVPILEHLRDASVLRNDILVKQPHVAFTLYDEIARFLSAATGLSFHAVLAIQQILTRGLGIWGLYLIGLAILKPECRVAGAWLGAAICSLGAVIVGPTVLTLEYEPTPRAFAVPLLVFGAGLAIQRRYMGAAIACGAAFLYHPPAAVPVWLVLLALIAWRREWKAAIPLAVAAAILATAAQGESQPLFTRLTPFDEQVQRLRAAYVWISMWPTGQIVRYPLMALILFAAFWRIRRAVSLEGRALLLGLPLLGLLSMPASWLLLERAKWALMPQVQPLRGLLWVTVAMELVAVLAGVLAPRVLESAIWFAVAYFPALEPLTPARAALLIGLAILTAVALRRSGVIAVAVAIGAFFALPAVGRIVNYPRLHTPELAAVSSWAASSTPRDAVFLFADAPRSLDPGILRADAQRAIYVDWKGGGQVNYLKDFAVEWWFRWQQTLAKPYQPRDLARYEALGITHVVLQPRHRLARPALFENSRYIVYDTR